MKKIFIICTIRNATESYIKKLNLYVEFLEKNQCIVYAPHRDTDQLDIGYNICQQNKNAILNADEIHIFYSSQSQGTHFDMGMAFALNKKIVIVENENITNEKSFAKMIIEWVNFQQNM